jgi:hypothetical protein
MNSSHFSRFSRDTCAYPYPGKSTKYQFSLIKKWLMSCVFPGLLDVFAKSFLTTSMFINEDLPTFDRPIKAYSGSVGAGHFATSVLLITNSADLISKIK